VIELAGEEKKRKPTVEGDIECPCCEATIHVKQFKIRTNEPVKPEYKIVSEVDVVKQGRFGFAKGEDSAGAEASVVKPGRKKRKEKGAA
jgi:hypothetical protein